MTGQEVLKLFEENKDAVQAEKMSAYMRGQFAYFGVPTPLRRRLSRAFLAEARAAKAVDWAFIMECWARPEREAQYLAVNYLDAVGRLLTPADIPELREIAIDKSWWDTVDGLDKIVGDIALKYPEVNGILLDWSTDKNIWLRRIAIDHQLGRKDKTNTELLAKIIKNNFGQTEFFVNKAIGWSLREYAKVNPAWVREFIGKYRDKLAPLSVKEAEKHLMKPE